MVHFNKRPHHNSSLSFKIVENNGYTMTISSLDNIDKKIEVEVYEGYRKLGKFTLNDIKLKFR